MPGAGAPGLDFETWVYNLHTPSSVPIYVRASHPKLRRALLISLPLEVINFWVIGYPAGGHGISHAAQYAAVALQWYVLHLPGIIAGDRIIYLREHHPILAIVLFIAGFIDTALLLLFFFWMAGLARRTLRKLSSPRNQLA
ncbi:MAG: hypothetical protein JST28_05410 [Acidobacteria bacterium]|nr:hypothetical protein [Acidobacteriota bacterium]